MKVSQNGYWGKMFSINAKSRILLQNYEVNEPTGFLTSYHPQMMPKSNTQAVSLLSAKPEDFDY
jgi:hypothetical protein